MPALGVSQATNAPNTRIPIPISGTKVRTACAPVVVVHGIYHSYVLIFSVIDIAIHVQESGNVSPCIEKLIVAPLISDPSIKP